MSKRVDYINNTTIVQAEWLDDMQEIFSRHVDGLKLEKTAVATIRATVDVQGSVITDSGKHRYVTVSPTVVVAGAIGPYNIYAIGGADSGADPGLNTNKAFTLEAAAGAAVGANPRLLGTCDWDGTNVKNVRFITGQQPPADLFNAFVIKSNDVDGVPVVVRGLVGQTTDYLRVGTSASDSDRFVLSNAGQVKLPVAGNTGGVLLGGDANLYRGAADQVKTDDALVVTLDITGNLQLKLPTVGSTGGLVIGADATLYRSAVNELTTGGGIVITNNLTVNGNTRLGNADVDTLGFFSVAGVARQGPYTATNVTVDRVFDANATSIDELADIVGTLITDLKAYGLIS